MNDDELTNIEVDLPKRRQKKDDAKEEDKNSLNPLPVPPIEDEESEGYDIVIDEPVKSTINAMSGNSVIDTEATTIKTKQKFKFNKILIVIVVSFLALCGGMYFAWIKYSPKKAALKSNNIAQNTQAVITPVKPTVPLIPVQEVKAVEHIEQTIVAEPVKPTKTEPEKPKELKLKAEATIDGEIPNEWTVEKIADLTHKQPIPREDGGQDFMMLNLYKLVPKQQNGAFYILEPGNGIVDLLNKTNSSIDNSTKQLNDALDAIKELEKLFKKPKK